MWIACFAILLNALAPAMSHAISTLSEKSNLWTEVCTANGSKWIAITSEKAPAKKQDNPAGKTKPPSTSVHCPFCLPHDGSQALSPFSIASFVPAAPYRHQLSALYQSAPTSFSWAVAQSRAPPLAT